MFSEHTFNILGGCTRKALPLSKRRTNKSKSYVLWYLERVYSGSQLKDTWTPPVLWNSKPYWTCSLKFRTTKRPAHVARPVLSAQCHLLKRTLTFVFVVRNVRRSQFTAPGQSATPSGCTKSAIVTTKRSESVHSSGASIPDVLQLQVGASRLDAHLSLGSHSPPHNIDMLDLHLWFTSPPSFQQLP